MPWNNNGGSKPGGGQGDGGRGPSPWGNPRPGGPSGGGQSGGPWGSPGGGGRGPDFDELIRQAQDSVRRVLPRRWGSGKGIGLLAVLVLAVWAASGFYRVQPYEQGVVLRFGRFDRTAPPGLNYHIPWPVESVMTPNVTGIRRVDVGFRASGDSPVQRPTPARDVLEESMMLTGDENIIDIDFAVFWRVGDVGRYLFSTRNPDQTVKSAAESMMREVIGRTPIQPALTEARAQIEQQVRQGAQAIMDQYNSGVEILQVQLQKVDPPGAVIEAFRDVQRAAADRERARNEAESYRNDIVPRARGEAQRLIQEATGYRETQVARANGETQRFLYVLSAYQQAQDITVQRMYLETMEEILRLNPKIVVDDRLQGLIPFLPLNEGGRGGRPLPAPPGQQPAVVQPARPAAGQGGGATR
ncbi:FtsH protease activity modulator HflK [Roseomonas sp. NAR14]|uniref:Protein HflK n=1 Tax=Roseomonas acroporae TaxID=2937791 RepID=A0A9X1Y9Q5_9PROT|nr:FtsH protease activity modulator HflK [Roseomonas acroporae]MCK8786504.1 FtsH protease activity modulator HflK [Roseomonas acroporae]